MDLNNPQGTLLDIYSRLLRYYGPQDWWPAANSFEVIVGAILTQNTAWVNVERALNNLRIANCMTPRCIRDISEWKLAQIIRPSGYFNEKAKKLKAMAHYLEKYADRLDNWQHFDPKELRAELLGVYGIGPETADDLVLYVAGLPSFVIDTYTRRIFVRLGLGPDHNTYEYFQAYFENNLPNDAFLFNEYHALLDRHGKETCRSKKPSCWECCLQDICRSGKEFLGYK